MFQQIGSFFSKLGKSSAFQGTLAAIGAAAAGEIGARLGGYAAGRGYMPTAEAQAGGGAVAAPAATQYGYQQPLEIPWALILGFGGLVLIAGLAFRK